MGTTADSWTVGGEITAATNITATAGSLTISAGNISVTGNLSARDYISFGIIGGYWTNGNYDWLVSDGDGIKKHVDTCWDFGQSVWVRMYVRNGSWQYQNVTYP